MPENNYKIELKFGLITGLIGFVWLTGEYVFGLHTTYIDYHPIVTNLAIVIPAILIPWGIKTKRFHDFNGTISFWDALKTGLVITVISASVSVLGVFVYYKTINPGWYSFVVDHYTKVGPSRGMTAKAAEEYAKLYFSMKAYMTQALFGNIAIGSFISVVASYFISKKMNS